MSKDRTIVDKKSYERIRKSVAKWPQWKKNYANEVIVSKNSKKI